MSPLSIFFYFTQEAKNFRTSFYTSLLYALQCKSHASTISKYVPVCLKHFPHFSFFFFPSRCCDGHLVNDILSSISLKSPTTWPDSFFFISISMHFLCVLRYYNSITLSFFHSKQCAMMLFILLSLFNMKVELAKLWTLSYLNIAHSKTQNDELKSIVFLSSKT